MFLEISQNSQENTSARDSFFIKLPATTVIFYYVEQKPPDVQRRNGEKRGDKEHHEKVKFSFHLAEFKNAIFCFVFEKTYSLSM